MDTARKHLVDRIRAAAADSTPLRIRGGGSKDFYGNRLQGELLDTTALGGVVSYEPSELVVTVGAGTPLAELEALLAEHGQCLPFEPPHFTWTPQESPGTTHAQPLSERLQDCSPAARSAATYAQPLGERLLDCGTAEGSAATIGGMVAAGLSGPARASVGAVREYVLGLHMVNGLGEELVFGGQVMKNVAGYDVSRMMTGSMGTLGLITQVSLKVLPVAPAEATLVFPLGQADALECLHRWGGQPLPLNASCWVHDNTAAAGGEDLLFVRLRGAVAAVEAACQKMLAQQSGQRMDPVQARAFWTRCRDQQLPFFTRAISDRTPATDTDTYAPNDTLALWRLSVPQTAPVLDLPWAQLVEWHGGQRWLWAPLHAASELQSIAHASGGSAIVFVAGVAHSTRAGGQFAFEQLPPDPVQLAIQQRLKHSLDPHGIFNPHRLFPAF